MKNKEKTVDEEVAVDRNLSIAVYKWLKIAQAIMMVALGVIFIVTAITAIKDDGTSANQNTLPIALGVVLATYGLLDIIAGYLLNRNLIASEVVTGVIMIGISIILFIPSLRTDVNKILTIFLISILFIYTILLIVFGIDKLLGKNGMQKSLFKAVISFVGASLTLASAIVYLIYKDNDSVSTYMMVILGAVMIILGIISFITLLIKVNNTKKMMAEQEKQNVPAEVNEEKPEEKQEVKVVDISDIKSETKKEKKIHNKERANKTVDEVKQIENKDDNETKQIENKENK